MLQRVADALENRDGTPRLQPPLHQLLQRASLYQRHHEVRQAILFTVAVNGQDIGMLEPGYIPRFRLKSCRELLVRRQYFGEDFDGDVTIEHRVERLVYDG